MMRDPILASRAFGPGRFEGERVPMVMIVHGGLRMIAANRVPHFSLIYWAHRKGFPNQREQGGAGHDTIRRYFGDRYDDLAALHLCDIHGKPMHSVANGWYWLAGALGGRGETHHGGNGKSQHWKDGGRTFDGYRESTPAECLATFARQWRLGYADALAIWEDFTARPTCTGQDAKGLLENWQDAHLARWAAEAKACIAKHGLRVYGDPWQPADA